MEHYTTVLIADNSDEFCAGLTEALQRSEGFQVVGTANDGEQASVWWLSESRRSWCWI